MHKGIILLARASDPDDAQGQVESFLEGYGDGNVWDWYVIGGRWSGELNSKTQEFFKKADKLIEASQENKSDFVSHQDVEKNAKALQKLWKDMGQTSKNPYNRDTYNQEGLSDDIMLATDCRKIIKEWEKDIEKEAEENWKQAVKERKKEKANPKKFGMSGYFASKYAKCTYDEFSFDSNVYDINEYTNKVPKNLKGYYAVMVDMHN